MEVPGADLRNIKGCTFSTSGAMANAPDVDVRLGPVVTQAPQEELVLSNSSCWVNWKAPKNVFETVQVNAALHLFL